MEHSQGFLNLVNSVKPNIKEVTTQDVISKLENSHDFKLIDVRESDEWNNSRIKQAIHLSKGIIERDIEKAVPDKNTELVLYCGGGFRSALAAYNLQIMGYTNVYSMAGGFRQWKENSLPIEN